MSNTVAINMYKNLGYIIYRTVLEYYSGSPDEDAYGNIHLSIVEIMFLITNFADMRKALSRDVDKTSVIPLSHPVRPEDIE